MAADVRVSDIQLETQRLRSPYAIFYNCAFTLLLCLSYSIRPNLPSPNASQLQVLLRKLNIVFWMVLFPEWIVGWAVKQWYHAFQTARRYRDRGWTMAHGHFAVMGGFILYDQERPVQALSTSTFNRLLSTGSIAFPSIPTSDIDRKSKGSPGLASITLLQTTSFIVQCVARRAQGLPITQLEMMTLALVVMHALLLCFWWHKPLDARECIRLQILNITYPIQESPERTIIYRDFSREGNQKKRTGMIFALDFPTSNIPRHRLLRTIVRVLVRSVNKVFRDFSEICLSIDSGTVSDNATQVPLFYAPDLTDYQDMLLVAGKNILGTLFAATYFSMWFSHFPSHRDEFVWRISSLLCTTLPLLLITTTTLMCVLTKFATQFLSTRTADAIDSITALFVAISIMVGLVATLSARVALLLEALICLASLPADTRLSPSWLAYVPHFS